MAMYNILHMCLYITECDSGQRVGECRSYTNPGGNSGGRGLY